jgi:hypothetical protein
MTGCITLIAGPLAGEQLAGWLPQATWPAIQLMEFLLQTSLKVPGAVSYRSWFWPQSGMIVLSMALTTAWILQRLRQNGKRLPAITLILPHAIVLASLTFTSLDA